MSTILKSSTSINEHARREFDITRDEYALCSYIHYRSADARQKVRGMCCDKKDDIAYFVGVSRRGLYKFLDRMEAKGLLTIDPATGFISTTSQWVVVENNENKVHSKAKKTSEQSSQKVRTKFSESVNKVPRNNKVKKDKKEEIESEEAIQPTPTPSLHVEKSQTPIVEFFNLEEEKPNANIQRPAAAAVDAAGAAALINEWARESGQTVLGWYETARRKFTLNDFELLTIKFCGFYANHSDTGKRQRFLFDPVLFFRNQFVSWLSTENRLAPANQPQPTGPPPSHSRITRY